MEDVLEVASLLVEDGAQDEDEQGLVDLLDDIVVVGLVRARVRQDHLDDQGELLLEDGLNEAPAGGLLGLDGGCAQQSQVHV